MTEWADHEISGTGLPASNPASNEGAPDRTDVVRIVALVLWRLAYEQAVPVTSPRLDATALRYLRHRHRRLLGDPLPVQFGTPFKIPGEDSSGEYASPDFVNDPLIGAADDILTSNLMHLRLCRAGHGLGPTDDGSPYWPTVGQRLHEIAEIAEMAQFSRGVPSLPETASLDEVEAPMGRALHRGEWIPNRAERELAAGVASAIRVFAGDAPTEVFEHSWLARLRRLAQARDALRNIHASAHNFSAGFPRKARPELTRPGMQRLPQRRWAPHHCWRA